MRKFICEVVALMFVPTLSGTGGGPTAKQLTPGEMAVGEMHMKNPAFTGLEGYETGTGRTKPST